MTSFPNISKLTEQASELFTQSVEIAKDFYQASSELGQAELLEIDSENRQCIPSAEATSVRQNAEKRFEKIR